MPGLSVAQANRIKEELQRNALCLNSFKNKAKVLKQMSQKVGDGTLLGLIADGIENDTSILKEHLDALYADIAGMLNGNTEEE